MSTAKESANGGCILCFISESLMKAFFSPIQKIGVRFDDPRVSCTFQIAPLSSVSPSLMEAFFFSVTDNKAAFYEPRVMFFIAN